MIRFFFPHDLSQVQYFLRWLACFGLLCLDFFLFVAALINGALYMTVVLILWVYWIFGLAVPRLRNAGKPAFLALLLAIPLINIAMFVYLFAAPPKSG